MPAQSKMARPALENYPPEHLWYKQSLQDNSLIIHIGASHAGVSLFQRPTGSVLTLRTDSPTVGGSHPEDGPLLDKLSIPFVVALLQDGQFLWGNTAKVNHESMKHEQVLNRKADYTNTIGYWTLGSLLVGNSLPAPEELEYAAGRFCKVSVDLLLAIFFHRLINWVQNNIALDSVTLNGDIIFSVPFWLPSLARMRLKNAAAILGLSKVSIFNEGTLAAYITHKVSSPKVPRGRTKHAYRQILVFAESGGNIDLTYHLAYGDIVHMVAFAGNMYPFSIKDLRKQSKDEDPRYLDFTMDTGYKTRYNENRLCESHRVELIQGLLQEIWVKIPKNLRADFGRNMKIVPIVDNESWEKLFVTEFSAMFGISKMEPEPALINAEAGSRSMFWLDLDYTQVLDNLRGGCFEDLNPFELFGTNSARDGMKWEGGRGQKVLTIENVDEEDEVEIYEEYQAQKLGVGSLLISPENNNAYTKLTVTLRRNLQDGAYVLESVYGTNATGDICEALTDYEFQGKLFPPDTLVEAKDVVDTAWKYGEMYKARLTALRIRSTMVLFHLTNLKFMGREKKAPKPQKKQRVDDAVFFRMAEIDNLVQQRHNLFFTYDKLDEFMAEIIQIADTYLFHETTFQRA